MINAGKYFKVFIIMRFLRILQRGFVFTGIWPFLISRLSRKFGTLKAVIGDIIPEPTAILILTVLYGLAGIWAFSCRQMKVR